MAEEACTIRDPTASSANADYRPQLMRLVDTRLGRRRDGPMGLPKDSVRRIDVPSGCGADFRGQGHGAVPF